MFSNKFAYFEFLDIFFGEVLDFTGFFYFSFVARETNQMRFIHGDFFSATLREGFAPMFSLHTGVFAEKTRSDSF